MGVLLFFLFSLVLFLLFRFFVRWLNRVYMYDESEMYDDDYDYWLHVGCMDDASKNREKREFIYRAGVDYNRKLVKRYEVRRVRRYLLLFSLTLASLVCHTFFMFKLYMSGFSEFLIGFFYVLGVSSLLICFGYLKGKI